MRYSLNDLGNLITDYSPIVDKNYERSADETNKLISTLSGVSQVFPSLIFKINLSSGISTPSIDNIDHTFDILCDINSNKLNPTIALHATGRYKLYLPNYGLSNKVLYTLSNINFNINIISGALRPYIYSTINDLANYDKYYIDIKSVTGTLTNLSTSDTITVLGFVY